MSAMIYYALWADEKQENFSAEELFALPSCPRGRKIREIKNGEERERELDNLGFFLSVYGGVVDLRGHFKTNRLKMERGYPNPGNFFFYRHEFWTFTTFMQEIIDYSRSGRGCGEIKIAGIYSISHLPDTVHFLGPDP